jgi:site-specific DNA recombinase
LKSLKHPTKNYVAIYARVSTDRQGDSVDHQVSLLREVAKIRGEGKWIVSNEFIYEDEGFSATKYSIWQRPKMQQLLADAEQEKFQVVMFKGISRFARNAQEALDMLDRLKAKGLRVISEEENYDSSKENSNFMFTMHAAIAEYEAEKMSVRIRLGLREKAKLGEWCGGRIAEGYIMDKDNKLLVDQDRRHIVEIIFDLYVNKGLGTTKIAESLNKQGIKNKDNRPWNQLKISRIIKNQIYIGNLVFNQGTFKHVRDYESSVIGKKKTIRKMNSEEEWLVIKNNHEPIIDKMLFENAQQRIKKHAKKDHPRNAKHPLTGVIYCGKCGKTMNVMTRNTKYGLYRYYMCSTVIHYGRSACNQSNFNADDLEELVLLELEERLGCLRDNTRFWEKYIEVDSDTQDLQKKLQDVERELKKNSAKSADLFLIREDMTAEQYNETQQRLKNQAVTLKDRKQEIEKELNKAAEGASNAGELQRCIESFFDIDPEDKEQLREVFQELIEKMTVMNKDVNIKTTVDNYVESY